MPVCVVSFLYIFFSFFFFLFFWLFMCVVLLLPCRLIWKSFEYACPSACVLLFVCLLTWSNARRFLGEIDFHLVFFFFFFCSCHTHSLASFQIFGNASCKFSLFLFLFFSFLFSCLSLRLHIVLASQLIFIRKISRSSTDTTWTVSHLPLHRFSSPSSSSSQLSLTSFPIPLSRPKVCTVSYSAAVRCNNELSWKFGCVYLQALNFLPFFFSLPLTKKFWDWNR